MLGAPLAVPGEISVSSLIPQVVTAGLHGAGRELGITDGPSRIIVSQEYISTERETRRWGLSGLTQPLGPASAWGLGRGEHSADVADQC